MAGRVAAAGAVVGTSVRARAASPQPKSAMRALAGRDERSDWAMRASGWTGHVAACDLKPMWYCESRYRSVSLHA